MYLQSLVHLYILKSSILYHLFLAAIIKNIAQYNKLFPLHRVVKYRVRKQTNICKQMQPASHLTVSFLTHLKFYEGYC